MEKVRIDSLTTKIDDLKIKLDDLEKSYETLEVELDTLINDKFKLLTRVKTSSKSSGGHDPHYLHTLDLHLPNRSIRNEGWDSVSLNLNEDDIITLYEHKEYYDMVNIRSYLNPNSKQRLSYYFKYRESCNK